MKPYEIEQILAFLATNPMGVISTLHKETGAPESALVAFAETPDFEIIFQTLNDSRKYGNLKQDPRISFVVGWEIEKPKQITFQYEGVARELEMGTDEYKKYRTIFEKKDTPCTSEFLNNLKSRIFVAAPTWFSYSNYTGMKPRVIENTLR